MDSYGKELILDLGNCEPARFTRTWIKEFFETLCIKIDMQAEDLHFWDDLYVPDDEKETEPHLKGTSAIQFIKTSNITIHTLDILREVYLNIFSCKDFDCQAAADFSAHFFAGQITRASVVERGRR